MSLIPKARSIATSWDVNEIRPALAHAGRAPSAFGLRIGHACCWQAAQRLCGAGKLGLDRHRPVGERLGLEHGRKLGLPFGQPGHPLPADWSDAAALLIARHHRR
jgi:hypothetical protein